jgi:Ca2+-transporting ATPase
VTAPNQTFSGLSSEEAARRLGERGPNQIIPSRFDSTLSEARKILMDPLGLMLLSLGLLYLIVGSKTDAIILFFAYLPVTGVDVLLQVRANRALKALHSNIIDTAKVIRDGRVQEIPTKDIVFGDLIVFEEGQLLPADGTVIESHNLSVNEAPLTGESVPVEKSVGSEFFGGTTPLQGRGIGQVQKTAKDTRIGSIASLLKGTGSESTPLQKRVNHLIKRFFVAALFLAFLLFLIEWWRGNSWIQSLIVAVTFGMAAIPEEFPLVFVLYLSLGAWRLSRHGVLVKSLPSVEALGSVDVICTDKTGTLTEGRFQLESLTPLRDLNPELLWKSALMACEVAVVDSLEAAIVEKGSPYLNLLKGWHLQWDYPFEPLGKHMSHVWQNQEGECLISMKGAVEGVIEHCQLSTDERNQLNHLTNAAVQKGKRVLGLAYREGRCTGERTFDEQGLRFIGLFVFNDPTRESARHAVLECQKAGIEIKMLTGDHPGTAHAVADEIGMEHDHQLLFTGDELSKMKVEDRWKAFQQGALFSRVLPEQKYEMVQALKATGKVVAMTGDGINDAPALKLADIGISMGLNATDVARSTAQMILIKNDFKGIVEAVFEGRRIFQNLRRSFSYLIAFHVPIILLAFLPPLLGWGDLLLPIHIVFLELIIHPVSAFGFESLPSNEGQSKTLLSPRRFGESVIAGGLLSLVSVCLYRMHPDSLDIEAARTLSLSTVLFGTIAFIFMETGKATTLRAVLMGSTILGLTLLLVRVPALGGVFHFSQLSFREIGLALILGFGSAIPTLILRVKAV